MMVYGWFRFSQLGVISWIRLYLYSSIGVFVEEKANFFLEIESLVYQVLPDDF